MCFEDSLSLRDPEAAEAPPGAFCSHRLSYTRANSL
jgi:hypothetical protein